MGKHGLRFGHVALRTADVERILRWYDEAFGANGFSTRRVRENGRS